MTKTTRFIALVAASGLAVAGLAGPAMAFDRDQLAAASKRMVFAGDVPQVLHPKAHTESFNAWSGQKTDGLCSIPSADPSGPWTDPKFSTKNADLFQMWIQGKKNGGVSERVNVYPSAAKASAAFAELTKQAKKCTGTVTQNPTADDGTSLGTWTQTLSNGTANVGSLTLVTVHRDSENTWPAGEYDAAGSSRYDTYEVYTLAGNAIVNISFEPGSDRDVTKREANATNELAVRANKLWS